METKFKGRSKIEVSRFTGLGEIPATQLKETAMPRGARILLKVIIAEGMPLEMAEKMDQLMGKKPKLRFRFIQENEAKVIDLYI